MMDRHVTSTMQKGILIANVFQGKDTLLFVGLLFSLESTGTWLQEYPYLNRSWYKLHPCETNELMKLLLSNASLSRWSCSRMLLHVMAFSC